MQSMSFICKEQSNLGRKVPYERNQSELNSALEIADI